MRRQVVSGAEVLAGVTGQRPEGFRAPGYTMTDELIATGPQEGRHRLAQLCGWRLVHDHDDGFP